MSGPSTLAPTLAPALEQPDADLPDASAAALPGIEDVPLFAGLSAAQRARVEGLCTRSRLGHGRLVFQAGDAAPGLYVIARGAVELLVPQPRGAQHLVTLQAGSCFGDGAGAPDEAVPVSAWSARAVGDCELLCLDADALHRLQAVDELAALRLLANLSAQRARDFRQLGETALRSLHEAQRAAAQVRRRAEPFIVNMLVSLCVYVFVLQLAAQLIHDKFSTSWLSIPGFIVFFIVFHRAARRSGEPMSAYGVTLRHWRRSLGESLLASLPVMVLCVGAKALLVALHPRMQGEALFALPTHLHGDALGLMLAEAAAYAFFAPFQEFIVRGAMQGSLAEFLAGPRRLLKAILITNLMYAALHLYMSVIFSVMVLVPGLLWGWLYARHRTLVGVSVSHALCGIFGFFVVGFDTLIMIYG